MIIAATVMQPKTKFELCDMQEYHYDLLFLLLLEQCEKFSLVHVCSQQKLPNFKRIRVNNANNVHANCEMWDSFDASNEN